MKKILTMILFAIGCACLLCACSEKASDVSKIETAKSGKIEAALFPADEVEKGKATFTPIVGVEEKAITDDGNGLYRVTLTKDGEGEVTLADTKVKEGTSVTVTAIPANEWTISAYVLDGLKIDSDTFVMPSHDVTFHVTFSNLRHSVELAGYGDEYYIFRETGDSAVAGTTFYFSVDPGNVYYYENEDVFVESVAYDDAGNRERIDVQKVGEDRFSFVMPDFDCRIGMQKREYGTIIAVCLNIHNDSEYYQIDYDEISNYVAYTLTMDGEQFQAKTNVKQHEATVTLTYLNPLYEIREILFQRYGSYETTKATKVDDAHYTFTVRYGYLYIDIKDRETPEGEYNVYIGEFEHGAVNADAVSAKAGDTVTLTVTPDDGYELESIYYTGQNSDLHPIERDGSVYKFEMPEGEVTVTATFRDKTEGVNLYVSGDIFNGDHNSYEFVEVIAYVEIYDYEKYTSYEVKNDMALPFHEYDSFIVYFYLNEGYRLVDIYYGNNNVTYNNEETCGWANIEVGDDVKSITVIVAPIN